LPVARSIKCICLAVPGFSGFAPPDSKQPEMCDSSSGLVGGLSFSGLVFALYGKGGWLPFLRLKVGSLPAFFIFVQ